MKKILLFLALFCVIPTLGLAQTPSNYGTEAGAVLFEKGNALFNKGKYEEAKVLYEQVLATGDKFYEKNCRAQLAIVNNLIAGKKQKSTVFTVSQDHVTISYPEQPYPIFVSGTNWKASVPADEDWCKVSVDRNKGIVMIETPLNQTPDSLETTVTITNGNGQTKTIKVVKEGAPEVLRSSASSLVFTPEGETNVVEIDANTEWSVNNVPEWLEAVKGLGDVQFTAKANGQNTDRVAQVMIETPSSQQIIINIIQAAALDSLAFSKNDLHFGPDGGDEYITVLTDAKDWRFGDFPHWCQLTRVDDKTIRVHCTPNAPVDMPREASINVTNGSQTLGINVSQDPKPIVHLIPVDGIGGRKISFGFSAGYVYPMISTSSSSSNTFSLVNYALGNQKEQASYTSSGGFTFNAFADIRLYKNLYLNAGLNLIYYKYRNELNTNLELVLPATHEYYFKGEALASFKEDYSMMTLDVPILASYRIPVTKTSHLQLNLGPVVSFGLSSKLDFSGKTDSESLRTYRVVNGKFTNTPYDNSSMSSHLNYTGTFDLYSKDVELTKKTSDGNNMSMVEDCKFDAAPYKKVNFGLRFGIGYEYMGISLSMSYQWMMSNLADKKFWESDRWTIFNNATELMTGYSQHNNLLLVTLGYTLRY